MDYASENGIDLKETFLKENVPCSILDGDEFYCLGETADKEIFINKDILDTPYLLIKYNGGDFSEIEKVVSTCIGDIVNIIVVNSTKKKLAINQKNVKTIEIPTDFIPPALIASCNKLIADRIQVENVIAEAMSVHVNMIN